MPPTVSPAPAPARRPLAAGLRRVALWVLGIIALIAILGFLVAPPLVKSQAETLLGERLHRKVSIERVRINPFSLTAVIEGFAMRERASEEIAASFESLTVSLSTATLLRLAPVLQAVRLQKPYVHLERYADGTYNFQDLVEEARAQPPGEGPPPKFSVNNIELVDGRIAFDDRPKAARHEVTDLRVGIPFVSNLPSAVDIRVQPALAAKVNGSPLELKGETKPFKDTRETTLNVDLDALQLSRYVEYSPVALPFRVPSGTLDTRLRLVFKTSSDDKPVQLLLAGEAGLRELVVLHRDGAPAVSLPALDVAVDPVDLVENRARVKWVRVEGLEIHGTRRKDGSISLLDLVPRLEPGAPAAGAPPFAFTVEAFALARGRFHLRDETTSPPFGVLFDQVTADVRDLSNAKGSKATVRVSYVTDAEGSFSYDGTVGIAPVSLEGRFALGAWRLAALYPYYTQALNVEVVDGKADAEGQVFVSVPAGGGEPLIKVAGANVALKSIKLRYPGEKRLFADVPVATVTDVSADVGRRSLEIARIAAQDGSVRIRRLPDGDIQLTRIVKVSADLGAAGKPPEADATWTYAAKVMEVQNFTGEYDDETVKPKARAELRRIAARLENISNAKGARFGVQARGVLNRTGSFVVAGSAGVNPVGGRLRVDAKGLGLPLVQPFIDEHVNLALTSGNLAARGDLSFELPAAGAPRVLWNGDVNVTDFASIDKPTSSDLLKWRSLYLTRVRFQLEPLQASVDEIALSDFFSRLILNADGTFNVQNLLAQPVGAGAEGAVRADGTRAGPVASKPAPPQGEQSSVAAEATEAGRIGADPEPVGRTRTATVPETGRGLPANVRVGRITLQGGNVNFSDFFIKPNYSANLTGIGGSVTEMTPQQPGNVELRGKVDNTAPVEIAGRVNPLAADLFLDIKASARDIELPPLSPYAIKYAGYGIEKGKLSMTVKYLIENRKLAAENNVYLDQLTFGEKVESPTATKLPVLLAVSLLKDRNGVIDVNLPISGSLDDPQFSVGGIIVQVIVNLLTKIVTAPFAALASAFGGKEELSFVEYAPGSAQPDGDARKRLDTLAKALNDRPQLKLEVAGRADPATDRDGLKRAYVDARVKAQKMKRLAGEGKAPASVDEVTVGKEEYPALLKAAYGEETFPKPRNVIGFAKDLPVPEMENLMLTHAQVGDEELRQLANRRAQAAKDYLVQTGKVPAERVFLVAPRVGGEAPKERGKPGRAEFSIR